MLFTERSNNKCLITAQIRKSIYAIFVLCRNELSRRINASDFLSLIRCILSENTGDLFG